MRLRSHKHHQRGIFAISCENARYIRLKTFSREGAAEEKEEQEAKAEEEEQVAAAAAAADERRFWREADG